MKFRKVLALENVEQWKDKYVDYYFLKECIQYHSQMSVTITDPENADNVERSSKKITIKQYASFEEELAKEASKVEIFFRSRLDKFFARLGDLTSGIELMKNGGIAAESTINTLRQAYHDNHLEWKLLRKFQETNKYGFVKILKKYDNEFRSSQFDTLVETYLQGASFWNPKTVQDTINETKNVYTTYFAASDEKLAKSDLRGINQRRKDINLVFVSLFCGALAALFVVCLFNWLEYYPHTPPKFASLGWFVYRITLLPILMGMLFSLSAYLWEKHNINYVFIFKINPAHNRSPMMYLKYSIFGFAFWLLSFYFFIDTVVHDDGKFHGLLHPLMFTVGMVFCFFLPLPTFGRNTRFFLIRQISRVLRAGLPGRIRISFADFIMAIQLIALGEFLFEFQVMFCLFGTRDDALCDSSVFSIPFLSALPHWCRMWQCIRRWRETGQAYPHLASGLRPASTLISLTISYCANKFPEHEWLLYLWLVLNSCFSVMRWYLDILIDWSFVKWGFDFSLRKQRLYKHTWLYYFVAVDNFILRFVWLIVYLLRNEAKLNLSHPILLLFLSMFELIWGAQFVFFRMENEHLNCSDRYNIIQDVPLPFTKKYETLARKNAEKNAKEKKKNVLSSFLKACKERWDQMPWVNQRQKLKESIAKAIYEVEKEHPPPNSEIALSQIHPSLSSTPNPSLANLAIHHSPSFSNINTSGAYILRSSSSMNVVSNDNNLDSSSAQILNSSTSLSRAFSSPYLTRIQSQNSLAVPQKRSATSSSPSPLHNSSNKPDQL